MNLTSQLGIIPEPKNSLKKAIKYLTQQHPGIVYDQSSDQFILRGERFDYFMSGVSVIKGRSNSYLLVDPNDHRNWLHDYGAPTNMWNDFMNRRNPPARESRRRDNVFVRVLNAIFQ